MGDHTQYESKPQKVRQSDQRATKGHCQHPTLDDTPPHCSPNDSTWLEQYIRDIDDPVQKPTEHAGLKWPRLGNAKKDTTDCDIVVPSHKGDFGCPP